MGGSTDRPPPARPALGMGPQPGLCRDRAPSGPPGSQRPPGPERWLRPPCQHRLWVSGSPPWTGGAGSVGRGCVWGGGRSAPGRGRGRGRPVSRGPRPLHPRPPASVCSQVARRPAEPVPPEREAGGGRLGGRPARAPPLRRPAAPRPAARDAARGGLGRPGGHRLPGVPAQKGAHVSRGLPFPCGLGGPLRPPRPWPHLGVSPPTTTSLKSEGQRHQGARRRPPPLLGGLLGEGGGREAAPGELGEPA